MGTPREYDRVMKSAIVAAGGFAVAGVLLMGYFTARMNPTSVLALLTGLVVWTLALTWLTGKLKRRRHGAESR